MNKILISIVVLSYNTKEITNRCICNLKIASDNLDRTLHKETEVIVIDNNSSDGSVEMIRQTYPDVILIDSKENTGFARGNNIAMKKSRGEYILILNSDAFVNKDTLVNCVQYMNNHKVCDVLGCTLKWEDGNIQKSAGYLPTIPSVVVWWTGIGFIPFADSLIRPFHPKNPDFYKTDKQVGWVTGAFFFLRRPVYEKTSGFDENYFMYGEEVEWCQRINEKGFNIWYTPSFWVTHLERASSGFDDSRALIKEVEGLKYFFHKHYKGAWSTLRWVVRFGCLERILCYFVMGRHKKAKVYWQIYNLC